MINSSLRELSAALAARKISAVELATLFLDRIDKLNPALRASDGAHTPLPHSVTAPERKYVRAMTVATAPANRIRSWRVRPRACSC